MLFHNRFYKLSAYGLIAILCMTSIAGCSKQSNNSSTTMDDSVTESSTSTNGPLSIDWDSDDLNDTWDSTATTITCNEDTADINGKGADYSNSILTINRAGTYIFDGTLSNAQIYISEKADDVIHIIFNGFTISNSSGAALYSAASKKTIVTLASGTKNYISDGNEYTNNNQNSSDANACLYVKDDLTINGTGSLTVCGNYNNGIQSKDNLKLVAGTINITSTNNGIKGKNSVANKNATINIESNGDGIQSSNDSESDQGYIVLEDGDVTISSNGDGIQAASILQINNGDYAITCANSDNETELQNKDDSNSTKGLKAGSGLYLINGTYSIDSIDDAIHSNGLVSIENGVYTISTSDDGIHGNSDVTINNGLINITNSYEGIEGTTVTINGGEIHLVASDDGINAASPSNTTNSNTSQTTSKTDMQTPPDMPSETMSDASSNDTRQFPQGKNNKQFGADIQNDMQADSDAWIRITDGIIYINAMGDGIDSNGSLSIDGGEIYIDGPTSDGNGALDYNGNATITGGIIIAAGSSGMAQTFGQDSTQASFLVYLDEKQSANTQFTLTDSQGNTVATYTPSKEYQSIVISTPNLTQGSTYSLVINNETIQSNITLDTINTLSGSNPGLGNRKMH